MGISYSLFSSVNLKRIWSSSPDDGTPVDELDDDDDGPPVRKKLKTADYIYSHLFVGGEGSDLVIKAFGCEWKLHRVYLAQSPYFASMFSGNWRESSAREVAVDFPDKRITSESLSVILGSLYKDTIDIELTKVISLVATAIALQLENVVQQCEEVMAQNVSIKTAHSYFKVSLDYGLKDVEQKCRRWFAQNLLHFSSNSNFLKRISHSLMASLLASPDLHVVQGEMDLYWLLKKWAYVHLCSAKVCSKSGLKSAADKYFAPYANGIASFLASTCGVQFAPVFALLRLHHILTSNKSFQIVATENLIPKDVMEKVMAAQWRKQLAVDVAGDVGEDSAAMEVEIMYQKAIRCGRVLVSDNATCWRWSGYFFGIDVLVSYKNRVFSIKRNCGNAPTPYSVNLATERKICYRLAVIKFNDKRQQVWAFDSGVKCVKLRSEETVIAAKIPSGIQFPLTIIFHFITVPQVEDFAGRALSAAWQVYTRNLPSTSDDPSNELYGDDDFSEDGDFGVLTANA